MSGHLSVKNEPERLQVTGLPLWVFNHYPPQASHRRRADRLQVFADFPFSRRSMVSYVAFDDIHEPGFRLPLAKLASVGRYEIVLAPRDHECRRVSRRRPPWRNRSAIGSISNPDTVLGPRKNVANRLLEIVQPPGRR